MATLIKEVGPSRGLLVPGGHHASNFPFSTPPLSIITRGYGGEDLSIGSGWLSTILAEINTAFADAVSENLYLQALIASEKWRGFQPRGETPMTQRFPKGNIKKGFTLSGRR